jgi:hypothetical protein
MDEGVISISNFSPANEEKEGVSNSVAKTHRLMAN